MTERPHLSQGFQTPKIFNRKLAGLRRARFADRFSDHDFLHRRAMMDIVDRLETVNRDFEQALLYGTGNCTSLLTPACGVKNYITADLVSGRLDNSAIGNREFSLVYDEEFVPFTTRTYDVIVSLLTLHSIDDLIGALTQYRHCLKPDGFFVAAMFGGITLGSFKKALMEAELEVTGGVAQRVHPFADVKDIGQALARAGFAMPVTDIDSVNVSYKDPMQFIADLRAMGETNFLVNQPPALRREVFFKALSDFVFDQPKETAELFTIEFEIIYLTGWAPHPDQQKPLKPGSAKISMADFFNEP